MAGNLPLANLRIIELAHVVAGLSVGKHLSDFGAQVIEVEHPRDGDSGREMGEMLGSRSAWWLSIARNKRSITLDLKHPDGRAALLRLLDSADAMVESFRPGVLERLDLARDPHYRGRGTLQRVDDEELGSVSLAAPVPRMSGTPGSVTSGSRSGHSTDAVFAEIGYSEKEIERGHESGAW